MVLGFLVAMAAALNKADLFERDTIGENSRSTDATAIARDYEIRLAAASSVRRGPREQIQSERLRGDELEAQALERCDKERERREKEHAEKLDAPAPSGCP